MKKYKNWFRKRVYPVKVINEQLNRALRPEQNVKENDGQHMKENGVPLVLTHNPSFMSLSFLIRKNFQFFYAHLETKRVFTPARFVFF